MTKGKNIFDKIKNMFTGEKKVENIVVIVILLVILLIAINYIFGSKTDKEVAPSGENVKTTNNTSNDTNINNSESNKDELETKLTSILNKIAGVTDAAVMVSYSSDSKKNPVYDVKQQENMSNENNKTTTQKTIEKSVAYEDVNGKKTAIVESNEMPIIEGVIVVAKGIYSADLKNKIMSAVAAVTNVPLYKVQVFERE